MFISTEKTGASVKYYYTLDAQDTPWVGYVENALITDEDLAYAKQNNERIWININGQNLADLVEITVGGETVPLYSGDNYGPNVSYISDDRINLSLSPNLANGWHDVTLKDADGNTYTYEKMCCVGTALSLYTEIHFGDLVIFMNGSALLSDGTLVLENPHMYSGELFNAYAYGLLSMACDKTLLQDGEQNGLPEGITIPQSAAISGSGSLRMNSSDAAYHWNSSDVIASGNYQIVYSQDELRVVEQH